MRTTRKFSVAIMAAAGLLMSFVSPAAAVSDVELSSTANEHQDILGVLDQAGLAHSKAKNGNVFVYNSVSRSKTSKPVAVIVSESSRQTIDGETRFEIGSTDKVSPDTLAILPELSDRDVLQAIDSVTSSKAALLDKMETDPIDEARVRSTCQTRFAVLGTQVNWSPPQNGCTALIGATWGANVVYQYSVDMKFDYGTCFQGKGHTWTINHTTGYYYVSNIWVNLGCSRPSLSYSSSVLNWGNVAGQPAMKFKAMSFPYPSGGVWKF